MLTIISGNNRDGYPCALNKVSDIFQSGISLFETEGLADVGEASQKGGFPLAGSLSKIFCSVNVASSYSAEVTVSMTSENLVGYINLFSPKSAKTLTSAKSRQRRSSMQGVTVTSRNAINELECGSLMGVCAGNCLNIKVNSAFVQTTGKEKGPRPALRVMQLITCEESNELHHNSHLQATGNLSYSRDQHLNKTGAGFGIPIHEADISRDKRFFCVRNQRCAPIMVGRSGGALALAGFFVAGIPTPLRLATLLGIRERGSIEPTKEATAMVATTQTRPEFIDTYWIIPEYSSEPYGKVSFTRQDRCIYNSLFKDSRLIWAGRQPVNRFTQGLKDPKSPKLPVEGIEEISTVLATITEIVTVQGVAHV
ncbi:hypothetical protein [Symbiopectobacterium sp. RP]|uniref:hypothetical protein n=1 Tax=Symbiopectobacterium sp. RP TaxID=3248553 RepID=UPI003D2CB591